MQTKSEQTRRLAEAVSSSRAAAEKNEWFADELHDGVLQSLCVARMLVDSHIARKERPISEPELEKALSLLDDGIDHLRAMIDRFDPPSVDDEALRSMLESAAQLYCPNCECHVSYLPTFERMRDVDRVLVDRAIKILLTNVARHANANRVEVSLEIVANEFRLQVVDDGIGPASIECRPGRGLTSLKRRLHALNGRLAISASQADRLTKSFPERDSDAKIASDNGECPATESGTHVECCWPLAGSLR